MKKEVLLFTSGIDSFIAREYLISKGHDIDCLYFNHGGRYSKYEMDKILSLDFPVIIDSRLTLKDLEADDAHIPNRNILFTTLALSLGYDKVWLGGSLSDRVGDNQSDIFVRLSEIMTAVNEKYQKIDSPFYDCYKDDMVRWYVNHHIEDRIKLVTDTFSCFEPEFSEFENDVSIDGIGNRKYRTHECLKCFACFRKCAVLYSGGIFIPFRNEEIIDYYWDQFCNPLVETARVNGTVAYIEEWRELKNASK